VKSERETKTDDDNHRDDRSACYDDVKYVRYYDVSRCHVIHCRSFTYIESNITTIPSNCSVIASSTPDPIWESNSRHIDHKSDALSPSRALSD